MGDYSLSVEANVWCCRIALRLWAETPQFNGVESVIPLPSRPVFVILRVRSGIVEDFF